MNKIEKEQITVAKMISLFCRLNHNSFPDLCSDCTEMTEYAFSRLNNCHYQDEKPVCSLCPVHCYKPEMREKIKTVMRYSGPRMILFHPVLAVKYLRDKARTKRSISNLKREIV